MLGIKCLRSTPPKLISLRLALLFSGKCLAGKLVHCSLPRFRESQEIIATAHETTCTRTQLILSNFDTITIRV